MDLNEIKKIMEKDGGKFIIVENGEPVMVITSFEEYKKRLWGSGAEQQKKAQIPLVKEPPDESEEEELKVEDLPL